MTGFMFTNPAFLWALPLAGLPVIFHLFFRPKRRIRDFPSLMFFDLVDPRLSARKKLREWLVLLLRTLLILFALLAIAHPVLVGRAKAGSIARVIIIDNSGSMQAKGPDGNPLLDLAVACARTIVKGMHDSDSCAIVLLAGDPVVPLMRDLESDPAALDTVLGAVSATEATGAPGRALDHALDIIKRGHAIRSEIHVLTDLQDTEWNRKPVDISDLPFNVSVTVHRLDRTPGDEPNVSVAGATLPVRRLVAGRTFPVKVRLLNRTDQETSVRLNSSDDQGKKATERVILKAREDKTVTQSLYTDNPGFHWSEFWVEGDGFTADNRASMAFFCEDRQFALFVGSEPAFGTLPIALSPSGEGRFTGIVPVYTGPNGSLEKMSDPGCVFVAITWDTLTAMAGSRPGEMTALRSFVERGGNLLVVPSATAAAGDMLQEKRYWIGAVPGPEQQAEQGAPVMVFNRETTTFSDLRNKDGSVTLTRLKAFRFRELNLFTMLAKPVAGLEDGRTLLAERKLGYGCVYTSGMAFDADWSNLALKSGFVVMMHNIVLSSRKPELRVAVMKAGESPPKIPGTGVPLHARSITGSPLDWKGEKGELPGLPRTGVYSMEWSTNELYVAVQSSPAEGVAEYVAGEHVPVLGEVVHSIVPYRDIESFTASVENSEKAFDFRPFLFLVALLALFSEGWIANKC